MAEALTNAEKALQTKIKQNSVESNKLNLGKMQATLLRLVKTMSPHFSLDETQCDIDKCLSYLEQAILSQSINGANDTTKSSLELLQENNRLQALVVNYKGVIVDTVSKIICKI
uniref:Uncharacterized protein n=1 Tax=Rhodnius prolixus TaxID=13249 RepID=T1IFE9_RHOPR